MLNDDYELSREDIQLLSSRDALAAFFAKLGYDTNDRLVQNVAAMGFGSDNLKSAITHIERLASQDGRMFEVYLFDTSMVGGGSNPFTDHTGVVSFVQLQLENRVYY